MKPLEFKEVNVRFAGNQEEYQTLPCHRDDEGEVTFCMELTQKEVEAVIKTGRVWLSVLTFNQPLQPIGLTTLKPEAMTEPEISKDYCPTCGSRHSTCGYKELRVCKLCSTEYKGETWPNVKEG